MGRRGLTLLQLITKPADERAECWHALVEERTEEATAALLRDYQRRGFVTAGDLGSITLTQAGHIRLAAELAHDAASR